MTLYGWGNPRYFPRLPAPLLAILLATLALLSAPLASAQQTTQKPAAKPTGGNQEKIRVAMTAAPPGTFGTAQSFSSPLYFVVCPLRSVFVLSTQR